MNRSDRLQELLRLDGLIAAAKERASQHRATLGAEAAGEYEREGMAPTWRWPELGTVILPISKETPVVADAEALVEWCRERYPSELETYVRIRPAFQDALLRRAQPMGECAMDPATGEVIPGLGVRPGGIPKALTIRATPEVTDLFAKAGRQMLDELMPSSAEIPGCDA
jgi:hypothetical protein